MAEKFVNMNPYASMGDTPIYFVDPIGLENTIYLINLHSSGVSQEEGVAFNMNDLSASDAVTVFGPKEDVTNYIQNSLGKDAFTDKWGGENHPGVTVANVSGISSDGVKDFAKSHNTDFSTAAQFAILHENGHPAKNASGAITSANSYMGEMAEGSALLYDGSAVEQKLSGHGVRSENGTTVRDNRFNSIRDFMKKEHNGKYIQSINRFFNSNFSKDNRLNRHYTPSSPGVLSR